PPLLTGSARSAYVQGDQARVVLGVGGAERIEDGGDHVLGVGDTRRGGGERGQPLVEGVVPALDEPVAVEQEQVTGEQLQRGGLVAGPRRAEQDAGRLPQRGRPPAAGPDRRRAPRPGPRPPPA